MIANRDRCEVAIIGAGPAGVSCACVLAQAGVDVVVFERGKYPGAKNMFGGIFFTSLMKKALPDFDGNAPFERFVAKRRHSMLVDDSEMAFSFEPGEYKQPPHNHCLIVKRSVFDQWFAARAEALGAKIVNGITVSDFLWDGNRVAGVSMGPHGENALLADVVVCAEGANSLLSQKAGLRNRLSRRARSVAVKEVIELPKSVIDERFGLTEREGAAYEYYGGATGGRLGCGFIYTNKESLSIGVAVLISEFSRRNGGQPLSPHDLLEAFKAHPCIVPLIRGGKTLEYAAHMIPTDGYKNLPRLFTDGLMLVGDAAGLLNNSFLHEGVNMAMASGIKAAETILANRKKKRYDAEGLSLYQRLLNDSFVLDDMKNCRNFLDILHMHREFVDVYPRLAKDALTEYFRVNDISKRILKRRAFGKIRDGTNMVKMASAFTSFMKGGF